MNKKTLLAIMGLVVLGAVTWYVLQKNARPTAGTAAGQVFAWQDTASVQKVVMTKRSGSKHTLERSKGTIWVIDGKEEAAPAMVQQLLMTVHDLKVKRPVTRAEREVVVKEMATDNIKIEVFTAEGLVRTFYLGSSTDEAQGNYALLEDSEEPVVVNLPSFNGYISPRFEITGLAWRNKHLFRSSPGTLQEVTVKYPAMSAEDVRITFAKGNNFNLDGVAKPDTARLIGFVTGLSGVYIEEFITDSYLSDSLSKAIPMAVFTLRDLDPKNSHTLRLFSPPGPNPDLVKQDHIYGYIDDQKMAVTIQPQNYLQLLARKSAFVKPAL